MNNEEKILAILEKQGTTIEKHGVMFEKQAAVLEKHGVMLEKQGTVLEKHGVMLEKQGAAIEKQAAVLEKHEVMLEKQGSAIEQINGRLDTIETDISDLKQGQTRLEISHVKLENRMAIMQADISSIKEHAEITRTGTNHLLAWADKAQHTINLPLPRL